MMFKELIFLIFCFNIALGGKATKKWIDSRKIMSFPETHIIW